jgi:peptidoglycan/LPS O-acetylase OafA/YrhL
MLVTAPDATGPQVRVSRRFRYQPGLDGLRALSVVAVICYHAGFSWMRGGWIGVEVFFVVSGFLITSLLLDEREVSGHTDLGRFWLRRARRLLPALAVVLAAVAVVTLAVGSAAERGGVRRDLPWAIGYLGNWGQIVGEVPYYAGDPPLLRHLWSLAIEEQFYLLWPLAFVALMRTRLPAVAIARLLAAAAVALMVWTFWLHAGGTDVNFMYLSTPTRATGLLLGAATAFLSSVSWRPGHQHVLDRIGGVALGMLGCIAGVATLTAGYVYQWLLPLVTVLSLVAVVVVVNPAATGMRTILGWAPLVAVGRRSYGLYLWHWPVFVIAGATDGNVQRVAAALAVTVVVSELTYRFVELPVRHGALGDWWRSAGEARSRPLMMAAGGVVLVAGCYVAVDPYDRAEGGADAEFTAPVPTTVAAIAAPQPVLPRRVAIVGDSQAHSLAVNLPDGIESTFTVSDGSLDGCSVYDSGRVHSARAGFRNSFEMCSGWQATWSAAAEQAEIVLVVLGAWDVFDLETGDGRRLTFGTPAWDDHVRAGLQTGIDAVVGAGAKVALLEVPCMRPIEADGAGVPPLPERADDARVAHVNEVLRGVAAASSGSVTFVEGPDAWCADEAVATDVAMRWDGVHVYKPGAKLVYDTIAPTLVTL